MKKYLIGISSVQINSKNFFKMTNQAELENYIMAQDDFDLGLFENYTNYQATQTDDLLVARDIFNSYIISAKSYGSFIDISYAIIEEFNEKDGIYEILDIGLPIQEICMLNENIQEIVKF